MLLNRLSEITKRDIYELFRDGYIVEDLFWTENVEYPYYGRLNEVEFLERLYDLKNMESNDPRQENAKGDIIRHTIANDDYPYCLVFQDERFGLKSGTDDIFLKFICEIFHPLVRDEKKQWETFFKRVNDLIKEDSYELYVKEYISV